MLPFKEKSIWIHLGILINVVTIQRWTKKKKKKPIPILVQLLKVDHKEKDYYNYTNSHIDLLSTLQPTNNFNMTFQKSHLEISHHDQQKIPINDTKCYNHRIETMHTSLHKHYYFWYQHWLIVPLAQDILLKSFIHKVPSHLVLGPLVIGVLMLN